MKKFVSATVRRVFVSAIVACSSVGLAAAQSLPSPWQSRDIGSPAVAGSATHSSGVFTITGAGADIWSSADQFRFVYQQVTGDAEIVARVDSVSQQDVWSKAGVMIRASLNSNSAHGFSLVSAQQGVHFQSRSATGSASLSKTGPGGAAPYWVRAVRRGSSITSYASTNGTSWTQIGTESVSLGSSVYVGIAVTSHKVSARTAARVSNVRVSQAAAGGTLPAGQQSAALGSPAVAGSATFANNAYTIRAAGADIWDRADQGHFVYQAINGNADVIARVASVTNTHRWSKAGVMIREQLSAGSRHATMFASYSAGYSFQRRPEPNAYSESTAGGSGAPPGWVRLVRTGDLFQAYRSTNGTSWTLVGSDTIPMADTVYVGIAATSHNVSKATSAVVDNVRIQATGGGQAGAVAITSPSGGAQYSAPATIAIAATASHPQGVTSVEFYAGTSMIVRDTTAPYTASYTTSTTGSRALTAVAYFRDGSTNTSAAVNVSIGQAPNVPPTVSLTSPAAGASFTAPATVALAATAADSDNGVARVEFYAGSTLVGSDTSSPYSFNWTGAAAGTYSITAVAVDASGARTTSGARSIRVAGATSTAPTSVVFRASSDHATNVTSYVLRVFASGANPSTATPVATSDLGKPSAASSGDITVNRASFFSGLAAGNYVATVMAVGPGGQTQSSSVTFSR